MKIYGNLSIVKYTGKVCLNYKILWTEIWNMSPEIFLKDEIMGHHLSIFESS